MIHKIESKFESIIVVTFTVVVTKSKVMVIHLSYSSSYFVISAVVDWQRARNILNLKYN